jgi:hypothetical protein
MPQSWFSFNRVVDVGPCIASALGGIHVGGIKSHPVMCWTVRTLWYANVRYLVLVGLKLMRTAIQVEPKSLLILGFECRPQIRYSLYGVFSYALSCLLSVDGQDE